MNENIHPEKLLLAADDARENAYTPYSHYRVGAALLGGSGRIYTGCNIENAAFTPTVCAERVALFKAVSAGERTFRAIAVVGGREGETSPLCAPCGVCRQVLSEFCGAEFPVILGTPERFEIYPLGEILPLAFSRTEL